MANKPLKIDDEDWQLFGKNAPALKNLGDRAGWSGGRSGVLRQFIKWYNGEPGVQCPRRPRASVDRDRGMSL